MFLGQAKTEQLFDDGGQANAWQPGQPRSQLGVKQLVRPHAQFQQTGQVLAGCMQDPFHPLQRIVDDGQVPERFRVDQPGTGAFAPDLHQERALAVPES